MVTAVPSATRKITSANPATGEVLAEFEPATEQQVRAAVARGARVLVSGSRLKKVGSNFYAPTIPADVTHQMRVMREERFGPVLPVMPFDSESAAVHLANDSEYGLGASIWTRSRRRGEQLARQIHAGTVMVNDALSWFGIAEAPHGGMRMSGDMDRMPGRKKVWGY